MSTAWPSYGPKGTVTGAVANPPTLPQASVPRTASTFGPAASWSQLVHPVAVHPLHVGSRPELKLTPVSTLASPSLAAKVSDAVPVPAAPGVALTWVMTGPVVSTTMLPVTVAWLPHASWMTAVTLWLPSAR